MCGIAGAFGRDAIDDSRIRATLSRMRNRGPDADGAARETVAGSALTLLHSRLAIIDLERAADQPMVREGCTLVFNGEIYNYRELRRELEDAGRTFSTGSDSEVLLAAYLHWGDAALDRLEGMWAFALLDGRQGRLVLSRDRFGEKPLLYMWRNGTLYFASEAKFLRSLSGTPLSPNMARVRRYLVNGFRSLFKDDETFFDGVREFPAGAYAVLDVPAEPQPKRYWRPVLDRQRISREDAVEGVRQRLHRSLELRLRADVPVAFCLSGGIDSTTLAGIAARRFGQELHAFSVLDRDERYDESENIGRMVEWLGCEHFVARVSPDGFFERMRRLVAYHDAPVPTISYYVHSFLSEEIRRQGYAVAISGTGADELFTGYYDHYAYWLAEMAKSRDVEPLLDDWRRTYGRWVNNPLLQDPLSFHREPDRRDHLYQNREMFNGLMNEPVHDEFAEATFTDDLLRNRMLNELTAEVVPVILRADDSNSMMWSVENRSPYLDRELAEFLLSVPSEHLIHDGYPKWLLRAAGEGDVPDEIRLDTRKRGFNASIESLLDRSDPATRECLMEPGPIFDLVRRDEVGELLSGDLSDNSFSKFAFSFISAKLFLETDLAAGEIVPEAAGQGDPGRESSSRGH